MNEKKRARRVGALIVFREGVTVNEASKVIREMEARGLVDREAWVEQKDGKYVPASTTPVHSYNPDHGSPVWYIP